MSINRVSMCLCLPVLSMRLAVLTVSPNKQYLGIVKPTTPAQHGPVNKFCIHEKKHSNDFMLLLVFLFFFVSLKASTKYSNLYVSLCVAAMALQVSVLF